MTRGVVVSNAANCKEGSRDDHMVTSRGAVDGASRDTCI